MHAPATNVLQDDGITGAREAKTRWHAAVRCAALLQLHAVIRTQRMTPEHVVSDNLGRMQRLVNRKKDRADLRQLVRLVRVLCRSAQHHPHFFAARLHPSGSREP